MAERAVIAGSETPAAGRHENLAPQADLMNQQQIPFDKQTAIRFIQAVRIFANSEFGWQAKLMFAGLMALLLGINGMNVLNSYVGRDFMTAIEHGNKAEFIQEAVFYIGVFAASIIVAVVSRFTEERLGVNRPGPVTPNRRRGQQTQ